MQKDWRAADPADFVPGLHKLESQIRAKDSRVSKVIALLGYSVSEILMYNSLGELTSDLRPMASLSVQVVYQSKGSVQTKSASRSFMRSRKIPISRAATGTTGTAAISRKKKWTRFWPPARRT